MQIGQPRMKSVQQENSSFCVCAKPQQLFNNKKKQLNKSNGSQIFLKFFNLIKKFRLFRFCFQLYTYSMTYSKNTFVDTPNKASNSIKVAKIKL